jgi:hypothetical protein
MAALAMCFFGVFVGYVVTTALRGITTWSDPVKIAGGLVSVIGAGGGLALVHSVAPDPASVYYYPLGLCYSALTTNSAWLVDPKNGEAREWWLKPLYIVALVVATLLLMAILLCEPLRALLPK